MRKILLPLFLLLLPLPAYGQWAKEKDLVDDANRNDAWTYYQQGLDQTVSEPERAIEHFLSARAKWKTEGPLLLYKKQMVRVGVVNRHILKPIRPAQIYLPSEKIFERYAVIKGDALRRAWKLPEPRDPAIVKNRFESCRKVLARLKRHKVNPIRLKQEEESIAKTTKDLLKKIPEPEKKTDTDKSMTEPSKKTDEPPKKPEKAPDPDPGPSSDQESLMLKQLEFSYLVERVKQFVSAGQRALKNGDLSAAVAAITSSAGSFKKLNILPKFGEQGRAEVALISSLSTTFTRRTRNMLAVSTALVSSQSLTLERRREIFKIGLNAAQETGASRWSVIQQQKMTMQLLALRRADKSKLTNLKLENWRETFDDTISRKALDLEVLDENFKDADNAKDWPFPTPKQGKPYTNRFVLAQSIRAFTLVEESWHARQEESLPEARRETIRSLLDIYGVLVRSSKLRGLSKQVRSKQSKACHGLKNELVQLVFTLFQENGQPTERFASYLLLLPELEKVLDREARALVLVGLGLAGLNKTGRDAPFWLVDRGLSLDPDVISKLPEEVPQWAVDKATERKKTKSGEN
jgi:hypothetical protein